VILLLQPLVLCSRHAASVVLETARCASGREPGCTQAEYGEIKVLLDGLESSSVALREVAIQVGQHCLT
jgi:hypothetical protein